MNYTNIIKKINKNLTPDFLKGRWKENYNPEEHPTTGHCYLATEVLYWILGGTNSDWMPHVLTSKVWSDGLGEGETHWFLKNKKTGKILDPTEQQFNGKKIDYDAGIPNGMMCYPVGGSKRARKIIDKIAVL